jgi:hypothetical protein
MRGDHRRDRVGDRISRIYVENVVARYSITDRVLDAFDKMVVAGTASLLASIHKFHPEIFTRGHP